MGRDLIRCLACSCVLLLTGGCGGSDGPELGRVTGKVTLGGKPLAKASVQFIPEKARMSAGTTDDEGKYELTYTRTEKGAIPGTHTVRVTTYIAKNADLEIEGAPETVPAKYNSKSTLKREVKAGSNEINLDLEANGEVIQPSKAGD